MSNKQHDDDWLVSGLQEPSIEDDGFSKAVVNKIAQQQSKFQWRWLDLFVVCCIGLVSAAIFLPSNTAISISQDRTIAIFGEFTHILSLSSDGVFALLAFLGSFTIIWLIEEFELL